MKTRLIVLSAVAVVALFLTASAYAAGPVLVDGDCPNTNMGTLFHPCHDVNVLFSHTPTVHSGIAVSAPTNTKAGTPSFVVQFSTTGGNSGPNPLFLFARGGQSDIDPCGAMSCPATDFINNITISVPAGLGNNSTLCGGPCFFRDLVIDPQKLTSGAIGDLTVTVRGNFPDVVETDPNRFADGSGSGNHFLTIQTTFPEDISSVTISAPSGQGFGDFKQPRISEINGQMLTPTPEASSLLLMGSGLLGIAGVIRRKLIRQPLEERENKSQRELQEC